MSPATVLVVEDNPITRKMLRVTLESEGYSVLEAGDGRAALERVAARRPDLVILDYVLPDTDGIGLLDQIRSALEAPELPAMVVTGMVSRLDELRGRGGPFTQVLPKPIEPSHLLEFVQAHLGVEPSGLSGRSILVIDDEPLSLKLAAVRLRHGGYVVETASRGADGLAAARRRPPDAIISDVLMPGMDGFTFCAEARRDPVLAKIPIVLVSSSYVDRADQELAEKVGANALVLRTPDLKEATAAVERILGATGSLPPTASVENVSALHRERLQVQLDRATARNEVLARQAAIQATALSVVRGLSEALSDPRDAPRIISDVLVHCLDATGLSTGLLYLVAPDGHLRIEADFGLETERRAEAEAFGESALIGRIIATGAPAAFAATPDAAADEIHRLLSRFGGESVLVVPFVVMGKAFGVLVLASATQDLSENAWTGFARSLAAQFGQTVALGQSLTRLAASESRHRALMEQANDAILILDLQLRIVDANRQAERLLGRTRNEILVRGYQEFIVPEERDDSASQHENLRQTGTLRIPVRHFLHADGHHVPVELSASLVHVDERPDEPIVLAILRDVTDRQRAEEALRESEVKYRILFERNPHPMYVCDADSLAFLAVNEAAVRHYGFSADEFLGMTILDIRPPEDRPALLQALDQLNSGERPPEGPQGLFRHRKKDGTLVQMEIAASRITFLEKRAWLVLALDITEKQSLEAQLIQAQKMESVGRLAGGVAHDFNNILGVIMGSAELCKARLGLDPHANEKVDDILKAAERGAGLTRQLLAFSRRQVLQPRILDLNQVVTAVETMLRRLIGEDIMLTVVRDPHLASVKADAGQIDQVLMNLVVNARDAMPQGGKLIIGTSTVDLDANYAATRVGVRPGRYSMLSVSDTGHGMSRDLQAQIFEPFFTTKEPGKGTGLGLATVHGIVKQSGGHVAVYSESGKGSTFKVYLPAVERAPASSAAPADHTPTGTETLLVVEDEPVLREIIQEGLERLGYTVLAAPHGAAALELAAVFAGPIQLMVTDVVMPGMGGGELAQRLALERPETKVLYMSGFTDDSVLLHGVLAEGLSFLEKPFTTAALARKVREVLDRT